ncbi:MAG: tyrosine-type recombinase/integrase [Candidatus Bathycorpusculaceae bacterium]
MHFHTLRHWKATMEYHKTKDIPHVMQLLGHGNIKNTLIYTQLIDFKEDEWTCKAAEPLKRQNSLLKQGLSMLTRLRCLPLQEEEVVWAVCGFNV